MIANIDFGVGSVFFVAGGRMEREVRGEEGRGREEGGEGEGRHGDVP